MFGLHLICSLIEKLGKIHDGLKAMGKAQLNPQMVLFSADNSTLPYSPLVQCPARNLVD